MNSDELLDMLWDLASPDRLMLSLGRRVLVPSTMYVVRGIVAWKNLDIQMPRVNRAYNLARDNLYEVGLLDDGFLLDEIPLYVAWLPSFGEAGFVYDEHVHWLPRLFGFEAGAIYLPRDVPHQTYVPGSTLTDTIRHEFAHSWRWLNPHIFEEHWFEKVFGATYLDHAYCPKSAWLEDVSEDRHFQNAFASCRSDAGRARLVAREFAKDFATDYASTSSCEDFAETFMYFLKYRNSLDRFKTRPGFYRKLKAVDRAVKGVRRQSRTRGRRA